ncbi:hypothetical protein BZU93_27590, partial [Salmonella enterica subsp. enterica]|nr:hypothetical protein [Salmonella enterica subsp. enterica serovar Java]MIL09626.1 hypothetical protein [Salmonella enterica subsp. enterica serovar Enteritidis]
AQVSFNTAEKNWDISARGNVHTKKRPVTLLGLKTPFKRRVPVFTTSPSFLRGDFARRCADLMDERFDPEKQFSSDVNPRLERFVSGYRNLLVGGGPDYLIVDTGRCWRDSRGITKSINNAVSTWEASRANAPD